MTYKTLALASIFLFTNQTYGLMRMPPPAPATAPWAGTAHVTSPALQQPELVFNPFFTPRNCTRHKPDFPLSNALVFGDTKHVVEYYSNWRGDFQLSDYHSDMHATLQEAAELDEKKGESLIDFLLTKLDPVYIKDPGCLLETAAKKNYPIFQAVIHQGPDEVIGLITTASKKCKQRDLLPSIEQQLAYEIQELEKVLLIANNAGFIPFDAAMHRKRFEIAALVHPQNSAQHCQALIDSIVGLKAEDLKYGI